MIHFGSLLSYISKKTGKILIQKHSMEARVKLAFFGVNKDCVSSF